MEHVIGIGGIFFKAADPNGLKAWYRDHLGVEVHPHKGVIFRAADDPGGKTVWAPFASDTTYFQPSNATFMINYRVRDMAAMLAQLAAAGVKLEGGPDPSDYGTFAWLLDPEGNKIELWQPPEPKP